MIRVDDATPEHAAEYEVAQAGLRLQGQIDPSPSSLFKQSQAISSKLEQFQAISSMFCVEKG
jgi:hypothetical protein